MNKIKLSDKQITTLILNSICINCIALSFISFLLWASNDTFNDNLLILAFVTLVTGAIFGAASAFYQEVLKQNP